MNALKRRSKNEKRLEKDHKLGWLMPVKLEHDLAVASTKSSYYAHRSCDMFNGGKARHGAPIGQKESDILLAHSKYWKKTHKVDEPLSNL